MGNYKNTLNLPSTTLPINASLPANEPAKYKAWAQGDQYARMSVPSDDTFVVHDGPPYANGDIHVGHALNKILKDFAVKFQYFNGKSVSFVPGWDCHGLPIQDRVMARIRIGGGNTQDLQNPELVRRMCRKLAAEQVEIQKQQFQSLGVLADWNNPYITMDFAYESNLYRSLVKLAKDGLLVERNKPVYWAMGTALAEAEIEYKDKTDDSAYVYFPTKTPTFPGGFLVWTTTPWTLVANVAVAINPNERYVSIKTPHQKYPAIVAEKLVPVLREKEVVVGDIIAYHDPKELVAAENVAALVNPLNPLIDSRLVLADFVTMTAGTGCVHIAPGHGDDDYRLGLKLGLPAPMYVGPDCRYTEEVAAVNPQYVGKHVVYRDENNQKADDYILIDLKLAGNLVKWEPYTHSYPYAWRDGGPAIFRATKQWFINLEPLREKALAALDSVEFIPENSKERLLPMVKGRPEWCISRQKKWGVPIAFLRNKTTGEILLDENVTKNIGDIFEREGCDCWWSQPVSYFVTEGVNPDDFEKVMDILDVWYDSGLSWHTLKHWVNWQGKMTYIEGNDQHRGWFQSSLWLATAILGKAPYNRLLTHGFIVDGKGEKMSKSKKNVIAPKDVIVKYGAEVLRYWIAQTDYTKEIRLSDETLKNAAEGHRKLRNTLRFLLANLGDSQTSLTDSQLFPLEWWILDKSRRVFAEVHEAFGRYEYYRGLHRLNEYITTDLSGIYMNAVKDRLYCDEKDGYSGQSARYAMGKILESLLGLIAPLFTYTADEVLSHAPAWFKGQKGDIFDWKYQPLAEVQKYDICNDGRYFDENFWKEALSAFHAEFDKIKTSGKAKDTLEVVIESKIQGFAKVEDWFVASDYFSQLSDREALAEFSVGEHAFRVTRSPWGKCERCWKRKTTVGEELCHRCGKFTTPQPVVE